MPGLSVTDVLRPLSSAAADLLARVPPGKLRVVAGHDGYPAKGVRAYWRRRCRWTIRSARRPPAGPGKPGELVEAEPGASWQDRLASSRRTHAGLAGPDRAWKTPATGMSPAGRTARACRAGC